MAWQGQALLPGLDGKRFDVNHQIIRTPLGGGVACREFQYSTEFNVLLSVPACQQETKWSNINNCMYLTP